MEEKVEIMNGWKIRRHSMLCISAKFGLIPLIVIVGFARQFCFHYDALGAQCPWARTPIATCDERCKPSRLINTFRLFRLVSKGWFFDKYFERKKKKMFNKWKRNDANFLLSLLPSVIFISFDLTLMVFFFTKNLLYFLRLSYDKTF